MFADFAVPTPRSSDEQDRRSSSRFSIERDLRYKLVSKKGPEQNGSGKTLNMSSSGILFTTDQPVNAGGTVELSISWPAQLNNTCALRLVARGRVVRVNGGNAAIQIQQYEFRTQGRAAAAVGAA
jgi:hypothetical protein